MMFTTAGLRAAIAGGLGRCAPGILAGKRLGADSATCCHGPADDPAGSDDPACCHDTTCAGAFEVLEIQEGQSCRIHCCSPCDCTRGGACCCWFACVPLGREREVFEPVCR